MHKLYSYIARGQIPNMKDSVSCKNTTGDVKLHGWIYADLHLNLHLYIKDAFKFLDV